VVRAAVGLDDEPAGAPEEVDLVALDARVDLRRLDPVGGADVAHHRLELRARQRRLVLDAGDDASERGRAADRRTRVDGRAHAGEVEQPQRQGALDDAFERSRRERAGDIHEGAGDRGHGDAAALVDIGGGERPRAMRDDPGTPYAAGIRGHRHVDRRCARRPKLHNAAALTWLRTASSPSQAVPPSSVAPATRASAVALASSCFM
jgi:hypothetical protein